MLLGLVTCTSSGVEAACRGGFPIVTTTRVVGHACRCFDETPRGTKIYAVDRYDIAYRSNTSTSIAGDAKLICNGRSIRAVSADQDLTYPSNSTVERVVGGTETAVYPNMRPDPSLRRQLRDGTARLSWIR